MKEKERGRECEKGAEGEKISLSRCYGCPSVPLSLLVDPLGSFSLFAPLNLEA